MHMPSFQVTSGTLRNPLNYRVGHDNPLLRSVSLRALWLEKVAVQFKGQPMIIAQYVLQERTKTPTSVWQ